MSGHCTEYTLGEKNVSSGYVNGTYVMNIGGYSSRKYDVHLRRECYFYSCIDNSCLDNSCLDNSYLDKWRFTD